MDFFYIVAYIVGYICLGTIIQGYWDKTHPGNWDDRGGFGPLPLFFWPLFVIALIICQIAVLLYNLGGMLHDLKNMAYRCLFGNRGE